MENSYIHRRDVMLMFMIIIIIVNNASFMFTDICLKHSVEQNSIMVICYMNDDYEKCNNNQRSQIEHLFI